MSIELKRYITGFQILFIIFTLVIALNNMKTPLLLASLLFIFCATAVAQHHFPKDSAEWKIWVINDGVPRSSFLRVFSFSSDTVLSGQDFKVLKPGLYGPESYIREVDSLHRVYFLYDHSDTLSNRLLYDFSKSVGDTINVLNSFEDTVKWAIVSIGLDSVGSGQRRYLEVKRVGWNYYDRWVEGIGSVRGLFAPVLEPSGWFETSFQLVCFTDKGTGMQYEPFPDTTYHCNTPAHVFEVAEQALKRQDVKVYPNPFTEKLFLENQQPYPTYFVLMTAKGKKLIQGKLHAFEKKELNTAHVKAGVYFLDYRTEKHTKTIKVLCR